MIWVSSAIVDSYAEGMKVDPWQPGPLRLALDYLDSEHVKRKETAHSVFVLVVTDRAMAHSVFLNS